MVDQPGDDPDAGITQPLQPGVVPREIELVRAFGRDRLPQDRVAHGLDPERDHGVDIAEARGMAGVDDLAAIVIADAHHGALDPAPQFERRVPRAGDGHAAAATVPRGRFSRCASLSRCASSRRRKVASAWPTIWSIL